MTTEEQTTTRSYYYTQEVVDLLAPQLFTYFEDQLTLLFNEAQHYNAFVGLRMFKRDYLEKMLADKGAKLLATALVKGMVESGKYKMEAVSNPFDSEHDTTAIRKVT